MTPSGLAALSAVDHSGLERQRAFVRGLVSEESRACFDSVDGTLVALQAILDARVVARDQTWELQALGVVLGDALASSLALRWGIIVDEYGRDPALELPGTTLRLFPLTMLSKRIEAGEAVRVRELFDAVRDDVRWTTWPRT